MYGLIYVTTLHPEYLYVLEKDKKEADEAKAKQESEVKTLEEGKSQEAAEWLKNFKYGKGKYATLDYKTISYL